MESEVKNNDNDDFKSIVSAIKDENEKKFFAKIEALFEKAYCI